MSTDSSEFTKLIDLYADGNDKQIQDQVIRTFEVLQSLVDGQQWCMEALSVLSEAAAAADSPDDNAFFGTHLGGRFLNTVKCRVTDLHEHSGGILKALAISRAPMDSAQLPSTSSLG